ncbi:MAG: PHP domain-containing protein, partial [Thermoplasmata archaeon]
MKFDLHVHSEHSPDSNSSVRDILRVARKKGLHGLAFMDHNTMDAYWEAESTSLIIVPGVEVSTPAGHVGALGIEESMGEQPDVRTAIRRILELNGLPVAMH